jgi:type I restriction enzyme S subunit
MSTLATHEEAMKNGWKMEPLGDLCEFQRGLTYAKGDEVDTSDNIVLRATNIDLATNLLNFAELKYINEKVVVPASKKVKKGSLMICTASGSKSHLGKVAYIDDDYGYAFGGFMGMITPRNGLVPKYLFHLLTSDAYKDFIGELSDGANINNLKFDDLGRFPVPHPAPNEQQRIVRILDQAFEGIATAKANAEKNFQNAHALLESHRESILSQRGDGWMEKHFADLCDIKHGYAFDGKFFSNQGEYVLLTPGNFYETGGYRDRCEKQKFYSGEIPRDYVLNEGDLLVAMTEQAAGLLGSPLLVPESDKFLHNQRLGLVTKKPGVSWTNEFFFHVFNTSAVRKAIHHSASGIKVRHTSPSKIGEVVVGFPKSLAEQKRILLTLAGLAIESQRLASVYERKLAALKALKKSLLHQAFTGNL